MDSFTYVGRSALCDTGCCPEDLSRVVDDWGESFASPCYHSDDDNDNDDVDSIYLLG